MELRLRAHSVAIYRFVGDIALSFFKNMPTPLQDDERATVVATLLIGGVGVSKADMMTHPDNIYLHQCINVTTQLAWVLHSRPD